MRSLRPFLLALTPLLVLGALAVLHTLIAPGRPAVREGIAKTAPALVASFDGDDDFASDHHEINLAPRVVHTLAWQPLPPLAACGELEAGATLPRQDRRSATLVGIVVFLI